MHVHSDQASLGLYKGEQEERIFKATLETRSAEDNYVTPSITSAIYFASTTLAKISSENITFKDSYSH